MSKRSSHREVRTPKPVNMTASRHEAAWDREMMQAAQVYRAAHALRAPHVAAQAKAKAEAARQCAGFWKGR